MIKQRPLLALLLLLVSLGLMAQTPTTFTYQGRLYNNGTLASGNYALRIRPYSQATGDNPLAAALTLPAVNVVDGIFSTTLDFGTAVFLGSPVWLEIEVQAPASSFVLLTPRQPVTPTPYAIHADKLDGHDAAQLGGLIPFSTGVIISGATMVSAAPRLMGFGSSAVAVIDGGGESTMPPEAGGFAFPIPFDGTIQNLQISADLLAASVVSINTLGLEYDFTVFRAPSSPNNGADHLASAFVTTPLTGSLRFGFPNTVITAGTFRSATASIPGALQVFAGDRIGIRVRTRNSTDPSAADVTQLSFSATLSYLPAPQP
jgi:hypothetical protein